MCVCVCVCARARVRVCVRVVCVRVASCQVQRVSDLAVRVGLEDMGGVARMRE